MNREIKFRTWVNGEMIYDIVGVHRGSPVQPDGTGYYHVFTEGALPVMQYTGLIDNNNTEIWEGDIFKTLSNNYGVIRYFNGGFVLSIGDRREPVHYGLLMAIKIVGNIYENPELLQP